MLRLEAWKISAYANCGLQVYQSNSSIYVSVLCRTMRSTTLRKLLQVRGQKDSAALPKSTDQLHQNHHPRPPSPSPSQPETDKSSSVPRWVIYMSCTGGVLGLVAVASTVYLLSHRKKDNTVIPWATGLSGQLSKAFVTGQPPITSSETCATD